MDVSPCIIKIEYTKPSKCGEGETCGHSEGRVDRGWCIGLCVASVLAQHYRRVLTLKYLIHGLTDPMMTSFYYSPSKLIGTRMEHRNYLRVLKLGQTSLFLESSRWKK